ncbi:MAG: hypothetical protein ACREIF_17890 [Chthoniobacterales bacterium]
MDRVSITFLFLRARRAAVFVSILLVSIVFAAGDAPPSDAKAQLNCALPRGISSFVIRLGKPEAQRCVHVVNENLSAEGRLSIAVSDRPLAAESAQWRAVQGAIPFRHKRRFLLSLVGVEANYVRLTFEVDRAKKIDETR